MSDYAPGMRVLVRDEEWIIKKVEKNSMGHAALHCIGITPLVKDHSAIFLDDIESPVPVDPARVQLRVDRSSGYRETLLYLESQWRQQIPTDTAIHIGDRAAMDALSYQLAPAQLALKKPRQRILIADVVGLGKTLEAGILMSELILRGKGKRILVVTGKSMMAQFQKELWNRFTIPLIALDAAGISRIERELPANYNPFFFYDKTIISIDTLKNDIRYRTHLEHAYWDIIVIDEAQNVAERGDQSSQRSKLAKLLAGRSDTMIMLSATPHDGRPQSFASLMNMLDPTAIADPSDYTADDIQGLFIRRYKKDVKAQIGSHVPERIVTKESVRASAAEERAYDALARMELSMNAGNGAGDQLVKTGIEKALFSSPAACLSTVETRMEHLRAYETKEAAHDIRVLSAFAETLRAISRREVSRYQRLLALLRDPAYGWDSRAADDRIVIFTESLVTMPFLAAALREDLHLPDDAVQTISGVTPDEEQQEIVERFGRKNAPVRILVASDVASEGLNLHYLCHRLIHYDLPWSLMTFQQRNGRIDRYGQTRQPDIRYLVTQTANERIRGDWRILEILVEKEEQAQKNIGDAAVLLGRYHVKEEEQAVTQAIEQGESAEDVGAAVDQNLAADGNDYLAMFLAMTPQQEEAVVAHDTTLYSDTEYLKAAMEYFNQTEERRVLPLDGAPGLEIGLTDDMKERMKSALPHPVWQQLKDKNFLRLYSRKEDVMAAVQRRRQSRSESDWPDEHYLWRLHPIFDWVDDKAGLICHRGEAPLAVLGTLPRGTTIFLMNGSIPNRRSTPLVDEWFGLRFDGRTCTGTPLPMKDALAAAGIRADALLPNAVGQEAALAAITSEAQALLPAAIAAAKAYLGMRYDACKARTDAQIDAELDKLAELEERRKGYQLSLFQNRSERDRTQALQDTETIFQKFETWVRDAMTIENRPYLRVIAVLAGRS